MLHFQSKAELIRSYGQVFTIWHESKKFITFSGITAEIGRKGEVEVSFSFIGGNIGGIVHEAQSHKRGRNSSIAVSPFASWN